MCVCWNINVHVCACIISYIAGCPHVCQILSIQNLKEGWMYAHFRNDCCVPWQIFPPPRPHFIPLTLSLTRTFTHARIQALTIWHIPALTLSDTIILSYTYTYWHTHTHTHARTHTHTHIHTYIPLTLSLHTPNHINKFIYTPTYTHRQFISQQGSDSLPPPNSLWRSTAVAAEPSEQGDRESGQRCTGEFVRRCWVEEFILCKEQRRRCVSVVLCCNVLCCIV